MIFDGEFQGEWESGEKRCSKLVFIGKNLDKQALEESFRQCLLSADNAARIEEIEKVKKMERLGQELLGAAHRDDVRAIEAFAAAGVDLSWGNVVGQTALHIAGLWANTSAVKVLLAKGANVNKTNDQRIGAQTPLHSVASRCTNQKKRIQCAKLLIAAGADLQAKDLGGNTPFDIAGERAETDADIAFAADLREILR